MLEYITKWLPGYAHAGSARFTLPSVIYEVAPGFVAGVRLQGSGRQRRKVRQVAVEPINHQTLDPHPSHTNIANGEDMARAAASLISTIGNGTGGYGLILPDGAVRVAILTFEALPDDSREAEALIRWRMKDRLPFNPEEARASFQILSKEPGHIEVLAVAVRASVIAEYESAFGGSNGPAALVLPATVAMLPLLPESGSGGQLLVHVCSNWLTAVVVAGSAPCVWRTRELDPANPAGASGEVASEAVRVLASARDRLRADMGRAWLATRPPGGREMASMIAAALGHKVELVTAKAQLDALLSADERSIFEQFGATVAGLIANLG